MNFQTVKNEAIKTLEKKASFYLDNGDVISAQACLAQIRVISGASQSNQTSSSNKVVGANLK